MARPEGQRIPVTVLTGFLGSGKTTVLNHVLRHPGMRDTAVIVNEFGEVGIDHLLVETAIDDMVLLRSGCLCCSIRGDLVDTLGILDYRRGRGEVPQFERVAVETTGLADPAPVLQTLMGEPTVIARYRLDGLVATVDAVGGAAQLDRHPEAVKQAALAARLLLTKTDAASPAGVAAIEARLARLNPAAPITRVIHGEVAPALLFGGAQYDPEAHAGDVLWWIDEDAFDGHGHRHGDDVQAFCITREAPLPWPAVATWLDSLTSLRGADMLRVKGIVNVVGEEGPLVLHGVQHVFHPPQRLARWPDDDRRTRIVCITRGIAERDLANALDAAAEAV